MVKNKEMQFFYGGFENEKKKGQNISTLQSRDLNPIFSVIVQTHDLNFHLK